MRATRVFFLLLSVLQFIFFLKLVEYVRGDEVPNSALNSKNGFSLSSLLPPNAPSHRSGDGDESVRGLFIAPKIKRKKLKPWIIGRPSNYTLSSPSSEGTPQSKTETTEQTLEKKVDLPNEQKEDNGGGIQEARLCPACENNDCAVTVPIAAGFPIVPVFIAVLVGIGWFVLFLIFWLFWVKPPKETGGYASGGYGSSPSSSYGPPMDDDDGNDKPGIFDHFMKPHYYRSFQSYTQMMNFVLDAVGKLAEIYKD